MDLSKIDPVLFRRQRALIMELVNHSQGEGHDLLDGLESFLAAVSDEMFDEHGLDASITCDDEYEDFPEEEKASLRQILTESLDALELAHHWVDNGAFLIHIPSDNCYKRS